MWQERGAKQALEVAIYRACEAVVAQILGTPYSKSLSGIAIDCGSKWAATVHAACKLLMARHNPPPVYAAKGFSSVQYREPYRRQTIKRRGHLADIRFMSPDREQMMQWDSHSWHMITQRGWLIPIGMPGSVCLYQPPGRMTHSQFAEEAAADVLEGTIEKNGKSQAVWKMTGRNEMGDVVAGAAALLSTQGVRPDAADDSKETRRAARKARKAEGKISKTERSDGMKVVLKDTAKDDQEELVAAVKSGDPEKIKAATKAILDRQRAANEQAEVERKALQRQIKSHGKSGGFATRW